MELKHISPEDEILIENAEKTILERYGREKSEADLSNDLTPQLTRVVVNANSTLRGKNELEILSYLESNGFRCTNGADIGLIAHKLAIHYGGQTGDAIHVAAPDERGDK